ncbi:MAG TPA: hypothetical protein VGC79_06540 [Polyangiaceae bacterium]
MSDTDDFSGIIARLEARYIEAQKIADDKLAALNVVRGEAGLSPRLPGIEPASGEGGPVLTQIKRDTFYGKKQMTAIREYLSMRRTQGDGPSTPREILDALKAGGYQFEAKSDDIALVGLRALLRKANNVFHKLPGTGSYGLTEWYPNARPSRDDADTPAPKKARGRPRKSNRYKSKALTEPESHTVRRLPKPKTLSQLEAEGDKED